MHASHSLLPGSNAFNSERNELMSTSGKCIHTDDSNFDDDLEHAAHLLILLLSLIIALPMASIFDRDIINLTTSPEYSMSCPDRNTILSGSPDLVMICEIHLTHPALHISGKSSHFPQSINRRPSSLLYFEASSFPPRILSIIMMNSS